MENRQDAYLTTQPGRPCYFRISQILVRGSIDRNLEKHEVRSQENQLKRKTIRAFVRS